jgi:hypothetical protein
VRSRRWKLVSLASSVLFVFTLILIFVCQDDLQILRWNVPWRTRTLAFASNGILFDSKAQPSQSLPLLHYDSHERFKYIRTRDWSSRYLDFAGFWFAAGQTEFGSRWMFSVPYWFPIVLFGLLPVVCFFRRVTKWRDTQRPGFPIATQESSSNYK